MLHGTHIIKSFDNDLDKINTNLVSMTKLLIEELELTLEFFKNNKLEKINTELLKKEDEINNLNQEILDASLKIFTLRSPVAWDLRYVFAASHMARSLEKNGDHLKKSIRDIDGLIHKDIDLDQKIITMLLENIEMHKLILEAFLQQNLSLAKCAEIKDDLIDQTFSDICNLLLQKIQKEPEKLSSFYSYLFLSKRLEHIGDNTSNISNFIEFIETGKVLA
ncbi:phosphate uptake regulator PhoU [Rickettsiales bacterium LUAb2]